MPVLSGLLASFKANKNYTITIDKEMLITQFGLENDSFWGNVNNLKEIQFHYSNTFAQKKIIAFVKNTGTLKMPKNSYDGEYQCSQIVITDGLGRAKIYGRESFPVENEYDFTLTAGTSTLPLPSTNSFIDLVFSQFGESRLIEDRNSEDHFWGMADYNVTVESTVQPTGLMIDTVNNIVHPSSKFLNDPYIQAMAITPDGTKAYVCGQFRDKYRNVTLPASAWNSSSGSNGYFRFLEIDLVSGAVTYLFEALNTNGINNLQKIILDGNYMYVFDANYFLCYQISTGTKVWQKSAWAIPNYGGAETKHVYFDATYLYTVTNNLDGNILASNRYVLARMNKLTGVVDMDYHANNFTTFPYSFAGAWRRTSDGVVYGWGHNYTTNQDGILILKTDGTITFAGWGSGIFGISLDENDKFYFFANQATDNGGIPLATVDWYNTSGLGLSGYAIYEVTLAGAINLVVNNTQLAGAAAGISGSYIYPFEVYGGYFYAVYNSSLRKINLATKVADAGWGKGVSGDIAQMNIIKPTYALFFNRQNVTPTYSPLAWIKDALDIGSRRLMRFSLVDRKYVNSYGMPSVYNDICVHTSEYLPNKIFFNNYSEIKCIDYSNDENYVAEVQNFMPVPSANVQWMNSGVDGKYLYLCAQVMNEAGAIQATDSLGLTTIKTLCRVDLTTRRIDRGFLPNVPFQYDYSGTLSTKVIHGNVQFTSSYIYYQVMDNKAGTQALRFYRIKKSDMSVQEITNAHLGVASPLGKYIVKEAPNGNIVIYPHQWNGNNPDNFNFSGKPYLILKESDLSMASGQYSLPTLTPDVLGFTVGNIHRLHYSLTDNAFYGHCQVSTSQTGYQTFVKIDVETSEITNLLGNAGRFGSFLSDFQFTTNILEKDGNVFLMLKGLVNKKFYTGIGKFSPLFVPTA